MAHHNDEEFLPATWPFRLAATVLIAGLIWFCLGMALHDVGTELANIMPIFYSSVVVALVLVLGGAIYNISRQRGGAAAK
ncbi:MAG TPA: hypothetical protein PKE32_02525 [Miltoncostaeaceae bacterium]|nr:hypothetical protein [Miltoncostaeaceae bacterium]